VLEARGSGLPRRAPSTAQRARQVRLGWQRQRQGWRARPVRERVRLVGEAGLGRRRAALRRGQGGARALQLLDALRSPVAQRHPIIAWGSQAWLPWARQRSSAATFRPAQPCHHFAHRSLLLLLYPCERHCEQSRVPQFPKRAFRWRCAGAAGAAALGQGAAHRQPERGWAAPALGRAPRAARRAARQLLRRALQALRQRGRP